MIADADGAADDRNWFADHPGRRYRARRIGGDVWIVRRRSRALLRTWTATLPPGLPDTDEALRPAWFAAAWPDLNPRTRAELVKEARKAESGAATKRAPLPAARTSGGSP